MIFVQRGVVEAERATQDSVQPALVTTTLIVVFWEVRDLVARECASTQIPPHAAPEPNLEKTKVHTTSTTANAVNTTEEWIGTLPAHVPLTAIAKILTAGEKPSVAYEANLNVKQI